MCDANAIDAPSVDRKPPCCLPILTFLCFDVLRQSCQILSIHCSSMRFHVPLHVFPHRRHADNEINQDRTNSSAVSLTTPSTRSDASRTSQHHSSFWQSAQDTVMAHRRFVKLILGTTVAAALLFNVTPTTAFASSSESPPSFFGTSHHDAILEFPFKRPDVLHPFGSSATCRASEKQFHHRHHGFTMSLGLARGGAMEAAATGVLSTVSSKIASVTKTPSAFFNACLVSLALTTTVLKVLQQRTSDSSTKSDKATAEKPSSVKSLQIRFLIVFWLLRCADWLQGPYFYEVYASKVFNGVQASLGLVSKLFLTGFASTALFGPFVGRGADTYGRKKGTLAFTILYALGAASTKSPLLAVLFLGRVCSGIGTSLLFSAPEAWLVGESQKSGDDPDGTYLGETFGMACAGDSIVAILAGQLAGVAAGQRGPTGPFELSIGFLAAGGLLTSFLWNENIASKSSGDSAKPSIKDAIEVIKDDPKIMLVGSVQSLFEAAMYIFVLQWPPAISRCISRTFGSDVATPYGTIFSCFMACCLLGSTLFGQLVKMSVPTERSTSIMLSIATIAMGLSALATSSTTMPLAALVAGFFAFEACVGFYFPSIGTLRSKYVPDSHRSVIMNLFGIPLNVLVVSVFLSIRQLGLSGALGIATGALGLASLSMFKLRAVISNPGSESKPATA